MKQKNNTSLGDSMTIPAFCYGGDEAEYLEDGTSKIEQGYFSWIVIYKYLDSKVIEVLNY